jgi:hypothetical protein
MSPHLILSEPPMTRRATVTLIVASALLLSGHLFAQDPGKESQTEPNMVNSGFQLFGGLGLPLGDFADSDKGAAKTGFAAGAQYTISLGDAGEFFRNSGIVLSGTYSNNGTDLGVLSSLGLDFESGSYSNIWALGGLKATLPGSESFSVDLTVALGAVFSSSPKVTASGPGGTASLSSASATAFAMAFAGDLVVSKHFTFGMRYYAAKPQYDIEVRTALVGFAPASQTMKVEQPTSILMFCVGYLF